MTVKFKMERATKNTIKFEEMTESEMEAPRIGTIYVPKTTLAAIGWKEGRTLVAEFGVE